MAGIFTIKMTNKTEIPGQGLPYAAASPAPLHSHVAMRIFLLCLGVAFGPMGSAQGAEPSPPPRQGAALLKTDLMGVFAHPDDETGVAATVAHYALGRGLVVAHIYATRGEGGGNMVGRQSGAALGLLREAELKDCLRILGVRFCYFLDRLDWAYTESATATLRHWNKEEALGRLVKLIRLLRPEVIVTMNPAPAPGQHGHHQAAGILATEAFTAAADPARFPEQILKEGLNPWQSRKLYYGGGRGEGTTAIDLTQALPGGKFPGEIAGDALSNHRSQGFGNFRMPSLPRRPQFFTLVKSVVPFTSAETDLFRDLPVTESNSPQIHVSPPAADPGPVSLGFVPRPAISNYLRWIQEQGIAPAHSTITPDLPLVAGEPNAVKLELRSGREGGGTGGLRISAPEGWRVEPAKLTFVSQGPGAAVFGLVHVTPPAGKPGDGRLTAVFTGEDATREAVAIGHVIPHSLVPRTEAAPAMDGTDRGWESARVVDISPADLVQGEVMGDRDSSARCRLLHDALRLFVDIEVNDDIVVSNIAPDDIKGHWRRDSVEICLDPEAGAEHTMACFKLGIIPFDTQGKVGAARDADANQGPVQETAPGTQLVSRRTPEGYRIQAAIPFSVIGCAATRGKRLGFNVIVYDGDDANAAIGANINQSRLAWSPRPGVQGRPEDWGRINLE